MLAAKATDSELQALFSHGRSYLLSPKIDGIRALVVNGQLVSRTMKPIRNHHTQALFGRPELEGLDGELVVGNPWDKNLMQQTSSGVMSYDGRPNVSFYVFDRWTDRGAYHVRYHNLSAFHKRVPNVSVLTHKRVGSYTEMLQWEERLLTQGYEGVMLRSLDGLYKQNRSTLKEAGLVKVKRFHDAEALVLGWEPLMRNLNEQEFDERGYAKRSHVSANKAADECLGSLLVRCLETGQEFNVGSGFTEAQRYSLWAERHRLGGRTIKYKSFKVTGVKDKPRHPIFLGFRDKEDM